MSKIIEIGNETFLEETKEGICLVDFWAPWCGTCRMLTPVLEELSEEEKDIKVCKVNTDTEQALAIKNNVRSIPHVLIMKDGEVVDQFIGALSKDKIKEKIQRFR